MRDGIYPFCHHNKNEKVLFSENDGTDGIDGKCCKYQKNNKRLNFLFREVTLYMLITNNTKKTAFTMLKTDFEPIRNSMTKKWEIMRPLP